MRCSFSSRPWAFALVHTREFGSNVTNALRCLQLEAHGYQINITERVGWEHSMKNGLIIATRKGQPQRRQAERLGMLGLEVLRGRFFVPGQEATVPEATDCTCCNLVSGRHDDKNRSARRA